MAASELDKDGSGGRGSRRAEKSLPSRKRPAHGVLIQGNNPVIVFLTVCTKHRVPWLADDGVHALLRTIWTECSAWLVGRYMIMPDHIHLFVAPGSIELPFDHWVRYWKSQFVKKHGVPNHRWQTGHWDRRLRRSESYSDKWEYVRANPVRHGLVQRPDDWPFQGEIHVLPW